MAMSIVESTRPVTGGVDTHLDTHVAAALDANGGVLGVESFPATRAGYASLSSWLPGLGPIDRVGVEGTGAYGAGLARHLRGCGLEVIEVDRPNRQLRRAQGKSDTLDAIEAARAVLSVGPALRSSRCPRRGGAADGGNLTRGECQSGRAVTIQARESNSTPSTVSWASSTARSRSSACSAVAASRWARRSPACRKRSTAS
jgi:hypothetical protein